MKLRSLLLAWLATVTFEAGASESVDLECREKLLRHVASLESAFATNRAQFDSRMDAVLTKYASSHPAASKADYKSVFDATFEERFRKLFTHLGTLSGYKAMLDGTGDAAGVCAMSERKLRKESEQLAARDKDLYEQIVREMSATFR